MRGREAERQKERNGEKNRENKHEERAEKAKGGGIGREKSETVYERERGREV